jgi:hypothetical protein
LITDVNVLFIVHRPLLLEFGVKALKLSAAQVTSTPVYNMLCKDYPSMQDAVAKAKILAYSAATWRGHISAYQGFLRFCNAKNIDPVTCTPPSIAIYLLELAAKGKSIGVINRTVTALAFMFKWLLLGDISNDYHLSEIVKFLSKTCPKLCNIKQAIGVKEIRKIWDGLLDKFGDITHVPDVTFRTFVMLVTQHASFCRYSDIAPVKLDDLLFDIDYFTINIRCSKTDQGGHGQIAYVPSNDNRSRCPHKLMCLYLHKFHRDPDPDAYLFPAFE